MTARENADDAHNHRVVMVDKEVAKFIETLMSAVDRGDNLLDEQTERMKVLAPKVVAMGQMLTASRAETADLTLEVERLRGERDELANAIADHWRPERDRWEREFRSQCKHSAEQLVELTDLRRQLRERPSLVDHEMLEAELEVAREQLAESEKKCQALTMESEGWARQLAEATGLLNGWCENFNVHWQPQALKDNSEAFLSRAPAQAAEPVRDLDWAAAQIVAAARAANCSVKYELQALTSDPEPST